MLLRSTLVAARTTVSSFSSGPTSALRRFARWIATPMRRGFFGHRVPENPWERFSKRMPIRQFGRGSWHPFPWYFEGQSTVRVASVDDVCEWLLGCTYVADDELFHESDFWQHPSTFERLRQGDCEDYALWAWRKLVELGHEAELMSGIWAPSGETSEGHVWVRFRHEGREYILETVARSRGSMIRLVDEVRSEYVPHAGVDERFLQHAYLGYFCR